MKILEIQNGLKTKFDTSNIKFKKTIKDFKKKYKIDANNTNQYIKKDGYYWKIYFISGYYSKKLGGRYFEEINMYPVYKALN